MTRLLTYFSIVVNLFFMQNICAQENELIQNRYGIKTHYSILNSFVKSQNLLIGRQIVMNFGGELFYNRNKMFFALFLNYHKSIKSIENSFVIYRDYAGYETGFGIRRLMIKLEKRKIGIGFGILLSGNYDKYILVNQYMVYPTLGCEIYAPLYIFKNEHFPIEISIPITYSFRQAGAYSNFGLNIQIGLCI